MRSNQKKWASAVAVLTGVAIAAGCATSPTGRKQLILMPDSQMDSMGVQAFQQMKSQTPVSQDPRWSAYVNCVVGPIIQAAKSSGKVFQGQWEVVVFKDDTANAFALPGGKIGVHTGILPVAKTDGQLAAVLGHEVGHVIARHGNERVSDQMAAQGGLMAAGVWASNSPNRNLFMGLLGMGAQVGVLLPFSRTQESEADLIGLDLMAKAGFDPHESVELWKNMIQAAGGKAPPQILSTHPASQNRIQSLQDHMGLGTEQFNAARAAGRSPVCTRP